MMLCDSCSQADSLVERTLQLAISLGGDTDTIASMAAAIAGAHSGVERIPESLVEHCEARDRIKKYAEDLFQLVSCDSNGEGKSVDIQQ